MTRNNDDSDVYQSFLCICIQMENSGCNNVATIDALTMIINDDSNHTTTKTDNTNHSYDDNKHMMILIHMIIVIC